MVCKNSYILYKHNRLGSVKTPHNTSERVSISTHRSTDRGLLQPKEAWATIFDTTAYTCYIFEKNTAGTTTAHVSVKRIDMQEDSKAKRSKCFLSSRKKTKKDTC